MKNSTTLERKTKAPVSPDRLLAAQREVALLREERAGLERRTQALQNKTSVL